MSENIICRIFKCAGCSGPIDTKKVRNPQRRYNIRRKARDGKPIYCNTRCFRRWFTYRYD